MVALPLTTRAQDRYDSVGRRGRYVVEPTGGAAHLIASRYHATAALLLRLWEAAQSTPVFGSRLIATQSPSPPNRTSLGSTDRPGTCMTDVSQRRVVMTCVGVFGRAAKARRRQRRAPGKRVLSLNTVALERWTLRQPPTL